MDKQLKEIKASYESVYDKETSNRIKEGVFNRLEENSTHNFSINKRITYLASAVIVVIGLFLGSGFVSPTMANVLSQLPYFDQIYKSMNDTKERKEELQGFYEDLFTALVKENTGVIDVAMRLDLKAPEVVIWVESEQVKIKNKKEFHRTVKKYAQKNDIENYSLDVKLGEINKVKLSDEEKKLQQLEEEIIRIAAETIKQHGYESKGIGVDRDPQTLTITIDESKDTFDKVKNNLKKIIKRAIAKENKLNYKVELDRITDIEKTENDWYPVFDSISNETQKNFSEVTGFAYSFHPQPLQIIIKTSLKKGEEGKENAAIIEEYTKSVTEIKRKEIGLEKIPYVIIIRDKKHDTLYTKTYK
jgi:hypothetical protein